VTRTKNDDVEDGGADPLVRARRQKLDRWRRELGITGYGHRVEGRVSLAEARARFDPAAHEPHTAVTETGQGVSTADSRPRVCVAGRCVQHRAMGKLVFVVLRDDTGDLQVSIAKPH
jgi:lysyl-tRNA synthetase class II